MTQQLRDFNRMFKRRKTDQLPGEGTQVVVYRRAWHSYVARRNLVVMLFLSFLFLGFTGWEAQAGRIH